MDQADKLPPWLCRSCAQRLENAYDFVMQARKTHELWIQKLGAEAALDDAEKGTLECLREAPIQLLEIEGVTIKMEESSEPAMPNASPAMSVDPLIKKCLDNASDDDDDVPLKQRKAQHVKLPMLHKCNICDKAFKYVTNLFRHKQRDHSLVQCKPKIKSGLVNTSADHSEPLMHNIIKSSTVDRNSANSE